MSADEIKQQAPWTRPAGSEPLWPARLALVAALIIYIRLPDRLVVGYSKLILPVLEGILIAALTLSRPHQDIERSKGRRILTVAFIGLINLANVASLALLVSQLLRHTSRFDGTTLIEASFGIWFTNVIVFGLWYWELDRGGPYARRQPRCREPDFQFPQMVNPDLAPRGWAPQFIDYLYLALTNAVAFSPTDVMPLTPWAKILMSIQSLASLLTIALVAARAVNILG